MFYTARYDAQSDGGWYRFTTDDNISRFKQHVVWNSNHSRGNCFGYDEKVGEYLGR